MCGTTKEPRTPAENWEELDALTEEITFAMKIRSEVQAVMEDQSNPAGSEATIPFGTMFDNEIGDGGRLFHPGLMGHMNVFPPNDERLNSSGFMMMNSSSSSDGRVSSHTGQQPLASRKTDQLSEMQTRRSTLRTTNSSEPDRGVRHQPPASRMQRESNNPLSRELRTSSRPSRQLDNTSPGTVLRDPVIPATVLHKNITNRRLTARARDSIGTTTVPVEDLVAKLPKSRARDIAYARKVAPGGTVMSGSTGPLTPSDSSPNQATYPDQSVPSF